MRGALEGDEERREEARVGETAILRPDESNDKTDDRNGQVENDQPPEPRQGALYEPPSHYFRAASMPIGANSNPLTLGGAATTPFSGQDLPAGLAGQEVHKGDGGRLVRSLVENGDGVVAGQ